MFKVLAEMLLRGRAHGGIFCSCKGIDLNIRQYETVRNRNPTGKVIGLSELTELAQINRSHNGLFTAANQHDA